jgi:predicted ATPase
MIGPNGAGKSNLVCLFKMLNFMTTESLQLFVGRQGGAESLLHFGADETPQMQITLNFSTETGSSEYHARLMDASPDTLLFAEERIAFHRHGKDRPKIISLGAGHQETRLLKVEDRRDRPTCNVIHHILRQCQVYNFHDTSETGRIRKPGFIQDNRYLRQDGGNLAAFLLKMRNLHPEIYEGIEDAVSSAYPSFGSFVLQREGFEGESIEVNWREQGSDYLFGPHQLPDGFLRFIALATLLMQPPEDLPDAIILDEPELGLHPAAISALTKLIKRASRHVQLLFGTQSVFLIDQLKPQDVLVVERENGSSVFRRLPPVELETWLDRYSLSQIEEPDTVPGEEAPV